MLTVREPCSALSVPVNGAIQLRSHGLGDLWDSKGEDSKGCGQVVD